jgi:hypothetical protein
MLFKKLTRASFIPIALETILLRIAFDRIHLSDLTMLTNKDQAPNRPQNIYGII